MSDPSDLVVDALRLGKAMEREAIVAWLVGYGLPQVANQIDNGLHLAGDDE